MTPLRRSEILVALTLSVLVASFITFRMLPVLPTILGDELIYKNQALLVPFSNHSIPAFFHSFVYSITGLFHDFYVGAKILNGFFLFVTLMLTYLLTRRLLTHNWGLVTMLALALGPFGLSVSFFTPELMLSALTLSSVYVYIELQESNRQARRLAIAFALGLLLALSVLVKFHAYFLVIGIILHAALVIYRSNDTRIKILMQWIVVFSVFVIVRITFGYFFAGETGLSITGGSYGSSLNSSVEAVSEVVTTEVGAPDLGGALSDYFSSGLIHFILLILFVLFTSFASFSRMLIQNWRRQPMEISLTMMLVAIYVVASAAFFVVVAISGDNHDGRLLGRYTESIWPLIMIFVMYSVVGEEPSKARWKIWVSITVSTVVGVSFLSLHSAVFWQPSDSLHGFALSVPVSLVVFCLAYLVVISTTAIPSFQYRQLAGIVGASAYIFGGVIASDQLISTNATPYYADEASYFLRDEARDIPAGDVLIVGTSRSDVSMAQFWQRKHGYSQLIVDRGTTIGQEEYSEFGAAYILLLNGVSANDASLIHQGDGFLLAEVLLD